MLIRIEEQRRAAVHALKVSAFETPGAELVDALREQVVPLVSLITEESGAIVGHITFSRSVRFGIGCDYEVPEEVFMVVELQAGFLSVASGKIRYHAAFNNG
jgi:predicted N-acetyltransferase YhbS